MESTCQIAFVETLCVLRLSRLYPTDTYLVPTDLLFNARMSSYITSRSCLSFLPFFFISTIITYSTYVEARVITLFPAASRYLRTKAHIQTARLVTGKNSLCNREVVIGDKNTFRVRIKDSTRASTDTYLLLLIFVYLFIATIVRALFYNNWRLIPVIDAMYH